MAKKDNCPKPVRRSLGGAAPACTACFVTEDWCYRLPGDTSSVSRAGKHTYDRDESCNRTNKKWIGDDGVEIDRCTVSITELLCGGGFGAEKSETAILQTVSSAAGNNLSSLLAGTSFSFLKTGACSIRVTTSVGSFVIPDDATSYCTQVFKTPFTVNAVEVIAGTCDLATITIISNSSF